MAMIDQVIKMKAKSLHSEAEEELKAEPQRSPSARRNTKENIAGY